MDISTIFFSSHSGVTVLLLTTVAIGVTTSSDCNLTVNENCQDAKNFLNKTQNNTSPEVPPKTNPDMMSRFEQERNLNEIYVLSLPVGLAFLSLSILTFALRCRKNKVTNVILINLCTTLLLYFLGELKLYTVLIGLECFLLLSSFVWMLLEAVLLLIFVKNLSKIRSMQDTVVSWKWLMVIGYTIPLTVLSISAVFDPDGFSDEYCNLKIAAFITFGFAISAIVVANVVLYIITIVIMIITLRKLKNGVVQSSNTVDKRLILSVVFKSLAQFFVFGCHWILNLFQGEIALIMFLILHTQQGTVIFFIHCVLNQEVRQMYWKFLRALCLSKRSRRQLEHPVGNQ